MAARCSSRSAAREGHLGAAGEEEPERPEAVLSLAASQVSLGEREQALKTLRAADPDLPKLSQACFAASEKIDPFAAKVARLEHQEETDPRAALKAAEPLLSQTRDVELLLVVARAHAHAGSPHEGVPALREALYMLAPWDLPDELVRIVCVDVPLAACMKLAP